VHRRTFQESSAEFVRGQQRNDLIVDRRLVAAGLGHEGLPPLGGLRQGLLEDFPDSAPVVETWCGHDGDRPAF
jgi:hypothetical protein